MEVSATNRKAVAGPDAIVTGAAGTEGENEELEWGKRHIPWEPPLYLADRVTALHDIPLAPGLCALPRRRPHRKSVRPRPAFSGTVPDDGDDDA
ncbi:hypothetical protein [Methanoregula sp.]|jgi:hypothetical protein|uniref:hypothetical protein n=1 Tax=Methanoregula sp. TaxID=2052170 RepID=UPI00260100F7|nr:hypothetical protein [Methanoregula sp.]